jgi:predicted ribosomally synthesized peptide with SipW-like signal peptide
MSMVLVLGLIGAGAFAYFSDTETSTGNTFTAGTLDLKVGGENPNASPDFTIGGASGVKPGDSGTITYALKNEGTLDGYLDLSGISFTDTEGTNPESETGDTANPGELSSNIYVTVKIGDVQQYAGLLSGIAAAYDADVALASLASTTLTIDWVVDKDNVAPLGADVGNDIQGDVVTVALTIELDQTAD